MPSSEKRKLKDKANGSKRNEHESVKRDSKESEAVPALNVHSHSGQSMHPTAYGFSCNMNQEEAPNNTKLAK